MKKILTPLACLLLAPLTAQTIQYGDLGPFGVSTDMHQMTSPASLPELSTGSGQTWDLSGITMENVGTMNFTYAEGSQFAAEFPTANWVWIHNITGLGQVYYYLAITPGGMDLLNRNHGLPSAVIYTDPVKIMKFPFALGESFTDEYSTGGNVNYKHWTFAGHGTLVLPTGTIENVALVTAEEGDVSFWNPDPLYPLMVADPGSAVFYLQNNVGINSPGAVASGVWPNPCNDLLNLSQATPGGIWQVHDAQGRLVADGRLAGNGAEALDVSHLAPGSYVLLLVQGQDRNHLHFVKQ